MTNQQEPLFEPLPVRPPQQQQVQQIEDPIIGLAVQFIVAAMLVRGDVELTIPASIMEQAVAQLITAQRNPDGGFTVRIYKD